MPHELEVMYGLTANELLDSISRRFRLRVALEGAVAEVHLQKHIEAQKDKMRIISYEQHDRNGYPDYTIVPASINKPLLIECKNVRNDYYRRHGVVVAYKVETQKTRAATSDHTSRYYNVDQFDILAVCLGKQTGNWSDFLFAKTSDLALHQDYPNKLAVFQT